MKLGTVLMAVAVFAFTVLSQQTLAAQNDAPSLSALPATENGDTNGDWRMDLSDAIYLLGYLFSGGPAPVPLHCEPGVLSSRNGDANGDGGWDLSDAVYLLSWLHLGGAAPADVCGRGGIASRAVQRSIDEFVAAQGTTCFPPDPDNPNTPPPDPDGCVRFESPVENFIGFSEPATALCVSFDYAGLAVPFAGGAFVTEWTGSVTEVPLGDGTALVNVRLHTKNALAWVTDCPFVAQNPTIFGQRVTDLNGNEPSLGETFFHVQFIAEAGAPFPDLHDVFLPSGPDDFLLTGASLYARADGTLADGRPGRATVAQTGIFFTAFRGATADGFPVEFVRVKATGS